MSIPNKKIYEPQPMCGQIVESQARDRTESTKDLGVAAPAFESFPK